MPEVGSPGAGCFNPFWTENGNMFGAGTESDQRTEPSWMNYVTTPAHPLGGSHVIEIDMSGTDSRVQCLGGAWRDFGSATASAKRWGITGPFFFRFTGTLTSDTIIAYGNRNSNTGWVLRARRAGSPLGSQITLEVDIDSTSPAGVGTKVLNADQWYLIEPWWIDKDSAGNPLATDQHVLRIAEGTGGSGAWVDGAAPTVTTDINFNLNTSELIFAGWLGDKDNVSGHGAGVKFYYANVEPGYRSDADDPYGVPRVLNKGLTANGSETGWTGSYTTWDEAPPNDATDSQSTTSTTDVKETSDMAGVTEITASDRVLFLTVFTSVKYSAGGKGTQAWWRAMIDDGTNETLGATDYTTAGSTDFDFFCWTFHKDPAGNALTAADLGTADGTVEIGIRGHVAGGGALEATAITAMIAWQKNGETLPAVAAQVLPAGGSYAWVM